MKLSWALYRRGGKRKKSLPLRPWNLNSTSNSPVAPRLLSCQISANQREARTRANANKHWKTHAMGNDVITYVISAPHPEWQGCSSENFENTPKRYQNLFYGSLPNSFLPLRGTNSTTTNYITGTANFNSSQDNFRTLSFQGRLASIVINLYPNKAHQLWQQSFYVLAP